MKRSLDLSNFLEEIPSLSQSVVFLCCFVLLISEDFLISHCYILELNSAIQLCIFFPFFLALYFSSFLSYLQASSDNDFAFLHFIFFGMALVTALCTVCPWFFRHSVRCNPLNLFITSHV